MTNKRVQFTPPGYTAIEINWIELVARPTSEGNFAEAFASADAIIDGQIESLLRQLYNDFKCQDLINEIHYLRSKVGFEGLTILEILKNKTIIGQELYEKVMNFKKARNLVLHNIEREYALLGPGEIGSAKDQETFDRIAETKARNWLRQALDIFEALDNISTSIYEHEEYYFSEEFYQKNPRGKLTQRLFPKE